MITHLTAHRTDYLDLIEPYIEKRESSGPKADKPLDYIKITLGACQLSSPVLLYWGSKRLGQEKVNEYCQKIKLPYEKIKKPLMLISTATLLYNGLSNLYKGFCYKKRMEEKLERDKQVRRYLRKLPN